MCASSVRSRFRHCSLIGRLQLSEDRDLGPPKWMCRNSAMNFDHSLRPPSSRICARTESSFEAGVALPQAECYRAMFVASAKMLPMNAPGPCLTTAPCSYRRDAKSRVAAYRRGQRACHHTSLWIRRGWPPVTFLVRQPVTELREATRKLTPTRITRS